MEPLAEWSVFGVSYASTSSRSNCSYSHGRIPSPCHKGVHLASCIATRFGTEPHTGHSHKHIGACESSILASSFPEIERYTIKQYDNKMKLNTIDLTIFCKRLLRYIVVGLKAGRNWA